MDLIRRSITNSANVTCTDPDGGTGDPDPLGKIAVSTPQAAIGRGIKLILEGGRFGMALCEAR